MSNHTVRLSHSCGMVKGVVAEGGRGERLTWAGRKYLSDCRVMRSAITLQQTQSAYFADGFYFVVLDSRCIASAVFI